MFKIHFVLNGYRPASQNYHPTPKIGGIKMMHKDRIITIWLLVTFLSLIFSAHVGQTSETSKNVDKIGPEQIETQKIVDKPVIQAARALVSAKIYVENDVKGTGQTAIFGEATAISAIGYDIVNYGGYFTAAGVKGRGVYGEALYSGDFENFGGYFRAWGDKGVGVYGSAPNYGGYFKADGASGIGVRGYASTTYGGYFQSNGLYGTAVHGYAAHSGNAANRGGFFEAHGSRGTGVTGSGGGWDFYAAGTGTNYGPFTDAHEVKFSEDMPEVIVPGLIVSTTGKTETRKDESGIVSLSSTLPTVTLSAKENDKAVFGVIVSEGPLPKDH
jgi:hypothetical protein